MVEAQQSSVQSRIADWASGLDPVAVGATCLLFLAALLFLEPESFSLETLVAGGLIDHRSVVATASCYVRLERSSFWTDFVRRTLPR